jgi:hypothetical protein
LGRREGAGNVKLESPSGEAVSFEGDVLVTVLERAFAPGAPVKLELDGMSIDGKAIGSKRREDGKYDVRLRLRNLRREFRERLTRLGS